MKSSEEVTALFLDYGSFIALANRLSEVYKTVYYWSPFEQEFLCLERCILGDGLRRVKRCDEYLDPKIIEQLDLVIAPDIGLSGIQKHFKQLGIPVWGSMGADEFELYRTKFLSLLDQLELPVIHSLKIQGLSQLTKCLEKAEDKWIKLDRYRENMETWHHIDMAHSVPTLRDLAMKFGPFTEELSFVVQDNIESDCEIGYDGWCIDGEFPDRSFHGYEGKNELYIGALRDYDDLPEEARLINSAMAPVLRSFGFRNFFSTELRIKDGVPYFIDPTLRMACQSMEHMYHNCENLAEIIWRGAQGEMITPVFRSPFAADATLHYKADTEGGWKILKIPERAREWVAFTHYCEWNGFYHFPPRKKNDLGVVIGEGSTIKEAILNVKKHFEWIAHEPLSINFVDFASLLEDIDSSEEAGIQFSDSEIPSPEVVVEQ